MQKGMKSYSQVFVVERKTYFAKEIFANEEKINGIENYLSKLYEKRNDLIKEIFEANNINSDKEKLILKFMLLTVGKLIEKSAITRPVLTSEDPNIFWRFFIKPDSTRSKDLKKKLTMLYHCKNIQYLLK